MLFLSTLFYQNLKIKSFWDFLFKLGIQINQAKILIPNATYKNGH